LVPSEWAEIRAPCLDSYFFRSAIIICTTIRANPITVSKTKATNLRPTLLTAERHPVVAMSNKWITFRVSPTDSDMLNNWLRTSLIKRIMLSD